MSQIDSIIKDATADAKARLAEVSNQSTVMVDGKVQSVAREPHDDQKLKAARAAIAARSADVRAAVIAEVVAGL